MLLFTTTPRFSIRNRALQGKATFLYLNEVFIVACFFFSVRAGRDKAAGGPAEDPRICPCEGQLEANTGL